MKTCIDCGGAKPLDAFYRNGGGKPGHHPRCKSCDIARQEVVRDRNRVRYEREGPLVGEKRCRDCGDVKSSDDFYHYPTHRDGLDGYCKDCKKCRAADFAKRRDPEAKRLSGRKTHLKRTYGITMDEFEQMVEAQQGCCAICERTVDQLVVDHDHDTGEVRELLCGSCNSAIGLLGDDPAKLRQAATYLEKHRKELRSGELQG